MNRYVCIHGHFYQPPRENPWLEAIELQDSAYPYHDWNERITAECYEPNAAARILDGEGRITKIVNNYSKISCNVGPTLLSWMQAKAPEVYRAILDADRESRERFSGQRPDGDPAEVGDFEALECFTEAGGGCRAGALRFLLEPRLDAFLVCSQLRRRSSERTRASSSSVSNGLVT